MDIFKWLEENYEKEVYNKFIRNHAKFGNPFDPESKNAIISAFLWRKTPEGVSFWSEIHDKWIRYKTKYIWSRKTNGCEGCIFEYTTDTGFCDYIDCEDYIITETYK